MFKSMGAGDYLFISIIVVLILGVVLGNVGWWIPLVLGTIYGAIVMIAYFRRGQPRGQNSNDHPT